MGEQAKQEEAKSDVKPEEKKEEKKEEIAEDKKEASPFVLYVDLHCVGCAKKIEKSILKIRGVEGVVIDMIQNQVTIKGVIEPQSVCTKIMKRTKRRAQILSPLPASEAQIISDDVNSQVGELTTVELNVNMHCEACAEQLKKKILKIRGVRTATTELSSSKVSVTGTMDPNTLVDYVYRRTKKQAKIVPQSEPEPELKPDEKNEKIKTEQKPEEKKEEISVEKKEGESESKEEKRGEDIEEVKKEAEGEKGNSSSDEQAMQRMVHYYQPLYVMERIPPPQLFSDENPNACCIV